MKNNKDRLIDAIGNIDDQYIEEAKNVIKNSFVFNWALTGKILTGVLCLILVVTIIPNMFNMAAKSVDSAYITESFKSDEAPQANYFSTAPNLSNSNDINYGTVNDLESVLVENSKLIITGSINIETLDFDNLLEELNNKISKYNAYIQNSNISSNRYDNRYYNATIRIPADNYNDFLSETKQIGNVTWYSEDVDDITETYTDLTARVNSLKVEEQKVLEFYDKATTLDELMKVENRLTEIRYEIDSIETRLKNYDLLTEYSTLNISIVETKTYTATNDDFFSRLSLSFTNGFTNFVNSIENIALEIVYNIWTIIIVIVLVLLAVTTIKKIRKNKK